MIPEVSRPGDFTREWVAFADTALPAFPVTQCE